MRLGAKQKVISVLLLSSVAFSSVAQARTYHCETDEGDLVFELSKQHLTVRDPLAPSQNQLVASLKLTEKKVSLASEFIADVTPAQIIGTGPLAARFKEVKRLVVSIAWAKNEPLVEGTVIPGDLAVERIDGDDFYRQISCQAHI